MSPKKKVKKVVKKKILGKNQKGEVRKMKNTPPSVPPQKGGKNLKAKKKVVSKKGKRVALKKGKKKVVAKKKKMTWKGFLKRVGIPQWLVVGILGILAGVGILGSAWNGMEWALADQILGGVSFLGEDVSLEDEEKVEEKLRREVTEFFEKMWLVKVGEEVHEMSAGDLGVEISIADTMRKLRQFGRRGGWFVQVRDRSQGLLFGKEVELTANVNEEKLRASLENLPLLTAPKMTDLVEMDRRGNLKKKEEVREFWKFDLEEVREQVQVGADLLMPKTVMVGVEKFEPEVSEEEVGLLGEVMKKWAERKLTLLWQLNHKRWDFELDFENDLDWFALKEKDGGLEVVLNEGKINGFLTDEVMPEISQPVSGARIFLDEEGEVKVEGRAVPGEWLDFGAARQLILAALRGEAEQVLLPVKVEMPEVEVAPEVTEKFGITGLLGTGWSDFSFSPSNRVNNVKVGMAKFDGVLVGPGEVFSFNENLGFVGSATGFLPELVIKENGTVPEFGGGLCQVSTTHYRAALLAGLPIVDRRNHTYHVFHYEPGGSDATIYPPNPDLKFQNDTDGWMLIQAWTDENGVDAFVNLFGKVDGRKVELEGPWISKWRKPGPSITIETEDLPVGRREIKEHEVFGFDAEWVRRIWKDGKLDLEEKMESHYLPWPEVILVGTG